MFEAIEIVATVSRRGVAEGHDVAGIWLLVAGLLKPTLLVFRS